MKIMKSGIIWQISIVILGIIIICNAIGLISVDVFFKGWWTLFIIIPAIQGLFVKGARVNNIFLLVIGFCLLLGQQGILKSATLWQVIFGGAFIIFGISSIYGLFKKKENAIEGEIPDSSEDCNAIFGGHKKVYSGQKFLGQNLRAIFGGIEIDLRDAIIDRDIRINVLAMFGGCDILVPRNVNIETSGTNFMGGIESNFTGGDPQFPTIHIYANTLFGGIKIK